MAFAIESEPAAKKKIIHFNHTVVRQTKLPSRGFVGTLLTVMRIEIDNHHNRFVTLR